MRVAREKSIDRQIVLASMEDAMQKAARSRYGQETEVRAEINPKTGEVHFSRLLLVVDEIENDATQITVTEARKKNPAAQVGDWIAETLPPFDFGRIGGAIGETGHRPEGARGGTRPAISGNIRIASATS